MKRILTALLLAGLVGSLAVAPRAEEDDRVTDEILLELAVGVSIDAIVDRYDVTPLESIPRFRFWRVRVAPGADVDDVITAMKQDPDILRAEPHRRFETPEGVKRSMADLDLSATHAEYVDQSAAQTVNAAAAHQRATGAGVRIAVIDTGMALSHSETRDRILGHGVDFAGGNGTAGSQSNGVDDDGDGTIDESAEHATFIVGIIHLAAPDATIVPIRVLEADGRGTSFALANGIVHAIDLNVDIINLSVGMPHDSRPVERAIEIAVERGILVVAAAGNGGTEPVEFPADLSDTIAVAAVDSGLVRLDFSSFGGEVDVSAPGNALLSTYGDDGFARWSGTSFAAPFVSGGLALLVERYPSLDLEQVREALQRTSLADNNPEALDGKMGVGVVNLDGLATVLTTDRSSLQFDDPTTFRWTAVDGALSYDVVRGDVGSLRQLDDALGETFVDLGPLSCIGAAVTATEVGSSSDTDIPPAGSVFFYLFRDDAPDEDGASYGSDDDDHPRQPGNGDCPAAS